MKPCTHAFERMLVAPCMRPAWLSCTCMAISIQFNLFLCPGGKAPIVQPNYGLLSSAAAVHRGAGQRLIAELLQRLGVHILSSRPVKVQYKGIMADLSFRLLVLAFPHLPSTHTPHLASLHVLDPYRLSSPAWENLSPTAWAALSLSLMRCSMNTLSGSTMRL